MKKIISTFLIFATLISPINVSASTHGIAYDYDVDWNDRTKITLTYGDGTIVEEPNNLMFLMINGNLIADSRTQTVVLKNNYSLVPIRVITEKIDAEIFWNDKERKVTINSEDLNIEMTIGSKAALVNGKLQTMQLAPEIINNYTYLPLRFISEQLGCDVKFYDEKSTKEKWQNDADYSIFAFPNSLISIESKTTEKPISFDEALSYLNKRIEAELAELQKSDEFKNLDPRSQQSALSFSQTDIKGNKKIDELGRYYCIGNDSLYLVDKYTKEIYILIWKYESEDYKARKIENFTERNNFDRLIMFYIAT